MKLDSMLTEPTGRKTDVKWVARDAARIVFDTSESEQAVGPPSVHA